MSTVVKPLLTVCLPNFCAKNSKGARDSRPASRFSPLRFLNLALKPRKIKKASVPTASLLTVRSMAEAQGVEVVEEKLGIRVRRNPSEAFLSSLGVRSWPKWGCPASEFPWTYSDSESCFLLKGKVQVIPDGTNDYVEFGAGDFVQFPAGMSCTWKVSEAVDKHYKFG